jgi:copper ion binding protein
MHVAVHDAIFRHVNWNIGLPGGSMKTHELTIQGMSCGHCVMHVKKALGQLNGLTIHNVEIGKATVEFDETVVTEQQIAEIIDEAGYMLVS